MILDNEKPGHKVYQWLEKFNSKGSLKIVTGYFSLGALAFIIAKLNDNISNYKFVLGDFIPDNENKLMSLDLFNEELNIDDSFKSSQTARLVVEFLKQSNVEIKTLEPNFCHAKAYLFETDEVDESKYIFGSSNLTEAGIGLKKNNNVELNSYGRDSAADYKDLLNWFNNNLWESTKAHTTIKINNKDVNFKEYLIKEIEKLFKQYTPREIYYKILYHLWGDSVLPGIGDPEFNRQIGKLENTLIYKALYQFQQNAVISLIKMLQKYNGAILADAVGLGKTWTALSVIKFFEYQGYKTVLLCPKKLERNWEQFLEMGNRFYDDKFNYKIRFHTDLFEDRWDSYSGKEAFPLDYVRDDTPKLIVIDESHNLRNHKSKRYIWFVNEILKQVKGEVKVLMLTATPINNSFIDIKNQFKLMVRDNNRGFEDTLGVRNLDSTFIKIERAFELWRKEKSRTVSSFIAKISDSDFFKLTDAVSVARTREMILKITKDLKFPQKSPPENIRKTPKQIGNFDCFDELFAKFPPKLSAYQPAFYIPQELDVEKIHDEQQRDFFLVKMMYILMVKRLESSWSAFMNTVEKILTYHQGTLDKVREYENTRSDGEIETIDIKNNFDEEDDDFVEYQELTLGKKRKIKISDIDSAGKLSDFKTDLKKDIESLETLQNNLIKFRDIIASEISQKKNNHESRDEKLEALIELINKKRRTGANNNNQKILIFTVFRDTALYLFDQLSARGFGRIGMVSGTDSRTTYSSQTSKTFEPILEQFAPYTKLFIEKETKGFEPLPDSSAPEKYSQWLKWIATNNKSEVQKRLDQPIDILIATDCLSEGQNLQDCDYVVNYDIHWNPVRVLQRCGRIDRLGSPNEIIFSANFWPTDNINNYLDLEKRIEDRMIKMKFAGSEIDKNFTEKLKGKLDDETLDKTQTDRMLLQLENTWDDVELKEENLGFDSFSLESFRQDLVNELDSVKNKYQAMPCAVYSGFIGNEVPGKGIVALLGYPARQANNKDFRYKSYDLIYTDHNGKSILLNQKDILDILLKHKDQPRDNDGLELVDKGDMEEIRKLSGSLKKWLESVSSKPIIDGNGTIVDGMGKGTLDLINKLKKGDKAARTEVKELAYPDEKFSIDNFDLITWMIIN